MTWNEFMTDLRRQELQDRVDANPDDHDAAWELLLMPDEHGQWWQPDSEVLAMAA